MKYTLLELVQDILSDIDGDEVNSITDTEESETVARHCRAAYNAIMSNTTWPHTRRALVVNPRSDSDYPTHMVFKDNVKELSSIYYNLVDPGTTRKIYKEMSYKDPDDFLRHINKRNNDNDNVDVIIDDSGIELLIINDKDPEYFTSFNDVDIVFDSYDSDADSTLQTSKVQAIGYVIPSFSMEDSFVADLPVDAFAMWREESVSRCQLKMRQFEDPKAESERTRQSRWLSRRNWVTKGGINYPDYGRKR